MTCKDCYHYECCKFYTDKTKFKLPKNAENCEDFKDNRLTAGIAGGMRCDMKVIICKNCNRSWRVPEQYAKEFEQKCNSLCAACRENNIAQESLKHLREWYKRDKTGEVDSWACVAAFNALEKQIPKKREIEIEHITDGGQNVLVEHNYCPYCHTEIDERSSPVGCKNCLQAIDWSDD